MPLLNYTTTIDVYRSIAEIQNILVKAGASAIMNEYDDTGSIKALSFKLKIDPGSSKEVSFRLPTNWRPVLEVMRQQKARRGRGHADIRLTDEQAQKVAWRITKDWIEAQMAIIETRMVTTAQVFLPYAVTNNGQTLYEHIGSNPQLLLGGGES